jgi:iron complex outermembrane recepter protein
MKVTPFQIRNLLFCGASTLALVAFPASAVAQDAAVAAAPGEETGAAAQPNPTGETPAAEAQEDENVVVVTGFRSSIASALNVKRNESGVVDAIVAEDIAEFPDLNLAESLQRIPGVAITRVQGEGRGVSVRGLGSEYTRVRLNGMEAITTSSGTANSGGTNRGRGFDFNIFASDLFSALIVRKTASADVEEGSLGATIDLRTARPFDFSGSRLVVSAQGSYNDLARDVQPRLAGLFSERFADGRIGVLVSAAYERRHLLEEGANITRWAPNNSNGGFSTASTLPGFSGTAVNTPNAFFAPRIPSYVSYDVENERLGLTGSIQFEPFEDTVISLDGLYSRLDGTRREAQIQALGLSRPGTGKPNTIITGGVVDADGNLITAQMDNVDVRTQSAYDELDTEFVQYTASVDSHLSDTLRVGGLLGYADSQFTSPVSTIITFDRVDADGFSYDFSQSRMPTINFGFDTANPANWAHINGISEVRIRPSSVRNQFTTGQVFGEWEISDALTFKTGADWRRFQYAGTDERRNAGELVTQTLTAAQVAQYSQLFGGFTGNTGLGTNATRTWVRPNLEAFARDFNIYCDCGIYELGSVENSAARGGNDNVRENTIGVYGQLDFRFNIGGIGFRGDVGGRWFRSNQRSSGYAVRGSTVELQTVERSYEMFLPAANLAADLTENLVARISAAQTISRPSLASLTPGGNVSVQGANRTVSSGNPFLDPTESNNLDLSLEWYPERGSVVALGFFYKDISTFVQTLRRNAVYSTLGLSNDLLIGTGATPDMEFQVTQPVNSEGGILSGFEINVQQSLDFLPGPLRNLGILANYTYVDSDIEYLTSPTPGQPTVRATLVGLSKHAANATLFYEDSRFSLRGSVAYRSGYLTQVPGSDSNTVHGTNGTINVDAQMSYNITDQLRLSVEALNLTDQYNDLYVGDSNRLNVYTHTGRQFLIGIRYSM